MKKYHYKENFWEGSTKEIAVLNEQDKQVMSLRILNKKKRSKFSSWLSAMKQEYEITDGKDLYEVRRERSVRTLFLPAWQVYHNHKPIGELKASFSWVKSKMRYTDMQANELKLQSGILSHSIIIKDERETELLKSKSSYFKIRTEHEVTIDTDQYPPLLLMLLFQVAFEYFEMMRESAASSGSG